MLFPEDDVSHLDSSKARTCKTCGAPMATYRPGQAIPEGRRAHVARGECSACYVSPNQAEVDAAYESPMWEAAAVGDIYTATFHRYAPPPPWTEDALCAQVDHDVFFPEKGTSTKGAKSICAACPVVAECLEYALTNREQFGVWGGKSEPERAEILRARPAS